MPTYVNRRRALGVLGGGVAAAGLAPFAAYARPNDVDVAIRQASRGANIAAGRIALGLPDRAELGTSVPLTVRVESPMTGTDYARSVHLYADANPRPRVLSAFFTRASGIAEVSTRIRLDGAQTVAAMAEMSDGSHWRADKYLTVAFGACGDLGVKGGVQEFDPISRIAVPKTAAKGETIKIRTLIRHPMETGFRLDFFNTWVPLRIIETLTVTFNGAQVFRARLEPAIATNPYLTFYSTVHESGTFRFSWLDTDGSIYTNSADITVT
jgi:thiosulfate oxidation carrier complex protein SoxZ